MSRIYTFIDQQLAHHVTPGIDDGDDQE